MHMPRTPRAMALRTRLVTTLLDRVVRKPIWTMDDADIRAARTQAYPRNRLSSLLLGPISPDVTIGTATAPARDGHRIPVRTYRPRGARGQGVLPVIVYFHGGGWVYGNVVNYDPFCSFLSDGRARHLGRCRRAEPSGSPDRGRRGRR